MYANTYVRRPTVCQSCVVQEGGNAWSQLRQAFTTGLSSLGKIESFRRRRDIYIFCFCVSIISVTG